MMPSLLFHVQLSVAPRFLSSFLNFLEDFSENVSWNVHSDLEKDTEIDVFMTSRDHDILSAVHLEKIFFSELKNYNLPSPTTYTIQEVVQKDWLLDNKLSFPPLEIGSFFIYGSHFDGDFPHEKIRIKIDAALAFGSGHHASTQGCLMAFSHPSIPIPKKVLDMGCGSGILSMAAAALFGANVQAVDIDPFSITTTQENIRTNHLAHQIVCFQSDGYKNIKFSETFDLIVCNILAHPLCHMAPRLKQHLKNKGQAVLSGFLQTQSQEVIKAHISCGLRLVKKIPVGEWETVILTND